MVDLIKNNMGQGLVEYVLILALVAVVAMGILTLLGPQIGNVFSRIVSPAYCGECICGTNVCLTATPIPVP